MAGDDLVSFQWDRLVPKVLHPIKVASIEALAWIGQPMSASELNEVFDREFGLSLVSYHLAGLAGVKAIRAVERRQVRGATKTLYFFPKPVR